MPLLLFETNLSIVICENIFSCCGCCAHVFYRIAFLNILRKFEKVIHVAEPFPSTKDISADVLLRTFLKNFLENLFSKTSADAWFKNKQTLVVQLILYTFSKLKYLFIIRIKCSFHCIIFFPILNQFIFSIFW